MTRPDIVVETDSATLAAAVASRLLDRIADIQAAGRVPSVVLTGGTIADEIHGQVARQSPTSGVDWRMVDVWWGDERFVPADDPERNAVQARTALLDHVDVDPGRVHEIPASDGHTLVGAAEDYSDTVRLHGSGTFDIVMLGLGPDGHVASLFPGFPQVDATDAIAVPVTDSPKPPPERVSLTVEALNRAEAVWFVVAGDGKADAVVRALGGADVHEIPATAVKGGTETLWLLDAAAASRLDHSDGSAPHPSGQ